MALDAVLRRDIGDSSSWSSFLESPAPTCAKILYRRRQELVTRTSFPAENPVKVICISDTHNTQPTLPPGDLLIHAGDLTQCGTLQELRSQLTWLNSQPHTHKIVIAGNHDILLDATEPRSNPQDLATLDWGDINYLQDTYTTLHVRGGRALEIYGSPWTRKQGNWVFQYPKGTDKSSGKIDSDTDIVVTHSPPRSHLDLGRWGDDNLLKELWRVRPKLSVFGHIHAGNGQDDLLFDRFQALYEAVCSGEKNGVIGCLWMTWLLLCQLLLSTSTMYERRTTLVNAASVGGMSDRVSQLIHIVEI